MGKKRSLAEANGDSGVALEDVSKKPKTLKTEFEKLPNGSSEVIKKEKKDKKDKKDGKKDKKTKEERKEKKLNKRKDKSEEQITAGIDASAQEQAGATIDSIFGNTSDDVSNLLEAEPAEKSRKKKKKTKGGIVEQSSASADGSGSKPVAGSTLTKVVDANEAAVEPLKESKKKKKKKSKDVTVEEVSPKEQPPAQDRIENKPEVKAPEAIETPSESTKKSKKKKKRSKSTTENSSQAINGQSSTTTTTNTKSQKIPAESETNQKSARFICFIGNLPFTATKESVEKHFASVSPTLVRLPSSKDSNEFRGFAFVEFDKYDRMKSCLSLYHNSKFDDGKSPPRRIRVELTAGGGGNTPARKEKLKVKNDKLKDERKRKHDNQGEKGERAEKGEDAAEVVGNNRNEDGIHPSRRARIDALRN